MMDVKQKNPVKFTSKGDEDVVKFNFFKMCFGLTHSFFPDVTWMDHIVPDIDALATPAFESSAIVASVDSTTKYYAVIAVQLPQMASGGLSWNLFSSLATFSKACGQGKCDWMVRARNPQEHGSSGLP